MAVLAMKSAKLPTVSVIIPMRNEEANIGRCLQSVMEQDYPRRLMEVMVIDGMSEDLSCGIVRAFVEKYPNIKLCQNPSLATTYALNKGIMESKGEVIVRVDAHCHIEPDYIKCCVEVLRESGAENVGGLMKPEGTTFIQNAIALAMTCPFGVGGGRFHYSEEEMFVDTVYLGAYRREVFDRIGLYDEEAHYSEDDELNYRLMKSGGKIFLSPRIRSHYYPRSSLFALWRQYYRYGLGKVRTIKKHERPASWRHVVPAIFILSVIISLSLWAINPMFGWLVVGILGSYIVSSMLVSVKICFREGWKYLATLPIVFFTLHTSYGLGFLEGVLRVYFLDEFKKILGRRTG
ncbi:MAG: glycosyltransferase [Candidatus Hermodarchaeia archaeon]|jgi:glycosyltransferase involved in cell wall biosynthesis